MVTGTGVGRRARRRVILRVAGRATLHVDETLKEVTDAIIVELVATVEDDLVLRELVAIVTLVVW